MPASSFGNRRARDVGQRRMSRPRGLVAIVVLVGALFAFMGLAQTAAASCAPRLTVSDAIAQSDLVVVGTVTSARSRNRIATVAVDEAWKGDVGSTVEVFGGPSADNSATSVDRTYDVGVRYFIVAYDPKAHGYPSVFGGHYEDASCSVTQPWTEALAAFRPTTAKVLPPPPPTSAVVLPADHKESDSATRWWVAVCAAAVRIVLTALWWIRRRRYLALELT